MNNRNKNQGEFHFLSETIHIFLNKTEIRFDHLKKEVTICRTGVNIEYYYFYYIITLSDFFFFFLHCCCLTTLNTVLSSFLCLSCIRHWVRRGIEGGMEEENIDYLLNVFSFSFIHTDFHCMD